MRYCTILAVCTLCLGMTVASWAGSNSYIRTKADLTTNAVASASVMNGNALKSWLRNVKPAAGHSQSKVSQRTHLNYWQQTVKRSKR